jgi:ATP-binding cassette subfamily B protein
MRALGDVIESRHRADRGAQRRPPREHDAHRGEQKSDDDRAEGAMRSSASLVRVGTLMNVPGRRFDAFTPDEPPKRPSDPAVRKANLRRIFPLFRPYRARLGAVCALIVFSAAVGVVSPFLLREVLDVAIPEENMRLLTVLVAGMVAIPIVTGIIGVYQTLLSNQVGQSVMHDLRTRVYRHLQSLSLAFFTRTRTGEVQSRIANDIGGIENVVTSTATSVLSNVTTVIATVVAMFLLDWRLAVFALALLPLFVWLTKRVGAQRKKVTAERQASLADVSSIVQESLSVSGILLGKTMGRADDLATRFEDESKNLAALEVRSRMTGRWMMASIQMTFAIMPALVYWFAGWSIANGSQTITIGTLVAFTTLQTRLFFPIGGLLGVQLEVQSSLALFDRIFEYLDHEVDIVEGDEVLVEPRGAVSLDSVWFRYDDAAWTLQDVSFDVPPGTKTALVGETGSGKTTSAYLVARLYDATEGSVSIDGVDVRDLSFESLTNAVGVVSQETYLFHSSVRENLRFARPGASDEEIEDAARAAQIHELIATLPEGYDTMVGERGYRFSGGEKQRMAIARTILRNPPVLVLDEATSSLDTQTERLVQDALERLSEGRTTIAIAHRLSTVRDADQIVVLDKGRIVEVGTYDELLARGGRFAELVAHDQPLEAEPV